MRTVGIVPPFASLGASSQGKFVLTSPETGHRRPVHGAPCSGTSGNRVGLVDGACRRGLVYPGKIRFIEPRNKMGSEDLRQKPPAAVRHGRDRPN